MVTSSNTLFNFEFTPEITVEQVIKTGLKLAATGKNQSFLYNIETHQLLKITLKGDNSKLMDFIISCKKEEDYIDNKTDVDFIAESRSACQ